MKIEVTEKGIYDGKGNRIPVGTEVNVKADELPAVFVNKARIIAEAAPKAEPITNPKKAD